MPKIQDGRNYMAKIKVFVYLFYVMDVTFSVRTKMQDLEGNKTQLFNKTFNILIDLYKEKHFLNSFFLNLCSPFEDTSYYPKIMIYCIKNKGLLLPVCRDFNTEPMFFFDGSKNSSWSDFIPRIVKALMPMRNVTLHCNRFFNLSL